MQALIDVVYANRFTELHADIRNTLRADIFDFREGLTDNQACQLSYQRVRFLRDRLNIPGDVARTPMRLFALLEWSALLDPTANALLSIHYGLCLGTLCIHGNNQPELDQYTRELESMSSFGVYLVTELGYGNNASALETEADYDPRSNEFILNTPRPRAAKFMPNATFLEGIPKLGIAMAKLKINGKDEGVFPFIVRLTDSAGPCRNIQITPLPHKPGHHLDNAITVFSQKRVPRANFVPGTHGTLNPNGEFNSSISRRQRFLQSVNALLLGRIGLTSGLVSCARASLVIALKYSIQRHSFAPGRNDVPLIQYRSQQRELFSQLAATYSMTSLMNNVKSRYAMMQNEPSEDLEEFISVAKAIASWSSSETIHICRERCGAQGMFAINRIADYVGAAQTVITAEGDNLVILSIAAGSLLQHRTPRPSTPEPGQLNDPRSMYDLLSYREESLRWEIRDKYGQALLDTRERLDAWNDNLNPALDMARTYGSRTALGSFLDDISTVTHPDANSALTLLATVYGLNEIAKDSGWYLAHGVLTADQVLSISRTLDELCVQILPYIPLLIEGFALPNSVLRTAIADDYLSYYTRYGGMTAQR
ncbi:acyl-CoA dehydrogenase [Lipingzhangella sp. LS1_29]|uniref:Acyl-CoA dehydrogenase n=1 Tax=Lipingzhangella rawalii TaxID=2055835 RepID=A0ABU2H6X5_9ACTN|nr:acyl-CoA dehydrogenase [Lipingzhangella rawalii]